MHADILIRYVVFQLGFSCDKIDTSRSGEAYLSGRNVHEGDSEEAHMQKTILTVDVGGSHVKVMTDRERTKREFPSGPSLSAETMVQEVEDLTKDWSYDFVSVGYPGPVVHNRPFAEPRYLGRGWLGFDFEKAFGRPTRMVNDAAMQALGSYEGGRMLFLGLGTGLGSAMIVDGNLEPMELGHLPYRKGKTYEDYVGAAGLKRLGKKKWQLRVDDVVEHLVAALEPEYVVLGGGNATKIDHLPRHARLGDNGNAFEGGFRLWENASSEDTISK
jgi:polyphosphate glucokinase